MPCSMRISFRDTSNETALGEPMQEMECSFSMLLSSDGISTHPNYSKIQSVWGFALCDIGRLSLRPPMLLRRVVSDMTQSDSIASLDLSSRRKACFALSIWPVVSRDHGAKASKSYAHIYDEEMKRWTLVLCLNRAVFSLGPRLITAKIRWGASSAFGPAFPVMGIV